MQQLFPARQCHMAGLIRRCHLVFGRAECQQDEVWGPPERRPRGVARSLMMLGYVAKVDLNRVCKVVLGLVRVRSGNVR